MSYRVEANNLSVTVVLDAQGVDPHIQLKQGDEVIVIRAHDLMAIKALRRAFSDIIDADKRRSILGGH